MYLFVCLLVCEASRLIKCLEGFQCLSFFLSFILVANEGLLYSTKLHYCECSCTVKNKYCVRRAFCFSHTAKTSATSRDQLYNILQILFLSQTETSQVLFSRRSVMIKLYFFSTWEILEIFYWLEKTMYPWSKMTVNYILPPSLFIHVNFRGMHSRPSLVHFLKLLSGAESNCWFIRV